jgi:hypothetical protein
MASCTVGEIQGKRAQSPPNEAPRRPERCLIGDLDPRFTECVSLVACQRNLWANAPFGGAGSLHGIAPNDFLTIAGNVETLSGICHRRLTQCGRNSSRYVQLPPAGRSHLLGIKAR